MGPFTLPVSFSAFLKGKILLWNFTKQGYIFGTIAAHCQILQFNLTIPNIRGHKSQSILSVEHNSAQLNMYVYVYVMYIYNVYVYMHTWHVLFIATMNSGLPHFIVKKWSAVINLQCQE